MLKSLANSLYNLYTHALSVLLFLALCNMQKINKSVLLYYSDIEISAYVGVYVHMNIGLYIHYIAKSIGSPPSNEQV